MEWLVHSVVRLVRATQKAYARKWSFLGLFALVFFISFALLVRLGFVPEVAQADSTPNVTLAAGPLIALGGMPTVTVPEVPVKIMISSINLSATVANPASTTISVLDNALLVGAVRYPTSGKLGSDNANVVIFGHSSYLPIVRNQAYKTFDGIQNLKAGATISVYSSDAVYTYAVQTVTKESAASGAGIPLSVTGKVLTLSTCDSFGANTDRWVVVATFVESHPSTN